MDKRHGFTIIELVVVLAFLIGGAAVFYTQKASIDAIARDADRKVAINAMYYSLEEVSYPKNGAYPQSIDSKTLRSVDPELFTDPDGYKMGDAQSNYHYSASDCSLAGLCKQYRLSADMEKEAEYVKTNRR